MRRNIVNSASGLKLPSPSCSATTIFYKRTKIVAIWQHRKQVLGIFLPRMRRNSYLGTSGQKSEPAIRSGDLDFHYTEWRLLDIFDVFVLLRRMVLWPWPLTLRVFHVQCFSCLTHIPIFIILRLSVTELRFLNIWSHFRYLKQSLRMRCVTWPLTGGKNRSHFWNPWSQFAYSLCHFQGATTKIKPCYRQK